MKARRIVLISLLLLLSAPVVYSGCGGGRPSEISYAVKQGGIIVGSQRVRHENKSGTITYGSVERRPYREYDTTVYRKLSVPPDGKTLEGYYASRRVPGASYRTYISRSGGMYTFLSDELQTFNYVPEFTPARGFLPFEADSACLIQALADKFFAAGVDEAVTTVIVPSRSAALREVLLKKDGPDGLTLTGEGLYELKMKFDGSGILSMAAGGTLVITKGAAGTLSSKRFAPVGRARAVKEVRVPTPEKLPDAERLELAGSLYIPSGKGPYRAVVLAGDFGPQDRTGGGFLSQFAERLVNDGMAVLACDKRGVPQSKGEYATYTMDSAVQDLNAQVDYLVLRGDVDIEYIMMIGYGEGGQVALRVAASNPYVSSLVLMATPSVPLWPDLPVIQTDIAETAGALSSADADAERIRVGTQVSVVSNASSDSVKLDGHEVFIGWMSSQAANEPLRYVEALDIPVLVVQGGLDGTVPAEQARRIMTTLESRGRSTQELALFEGLGHDFGPLPLEGAAVPYRNHPEVDPAVLETVSGWLGKR